MGFMLISLMFSLLCFYTIFVFKKQREAKDTEKDIPTQLQTDNVMPKKKDFTNIADALLHSYYYIKPAIVLTKLNC